MDQVRQYPAAGLAGWLAGRYTLMSVVSRPLIDS